MRAYTEPEDSLGDDCSRKECIRGVLVEGIDHGWLAARYRKGAFVGQGLEICMLRRSVMYEDLTPLGCASTSVMTRAASVPQEMELYLRVPARLFEF